jgi:hypothetical protein
LRLVFETLFSIELLIANREHKWGTAVFTRQALILHREPSCPKSTSSKCETRPRLPPPYGRV